MGWPFWSATLRRAPGALSLAHCASAPTKYMLTRSCQRFRLIVALSLNGYAQRPPAYPSERFDRRRCRRVAHIRVPGSIVVDDATHTANSPFAIATRDKDGNRKAAVVHLPRQTARRKRPSASTSRWFPRQTAGALVNFDLSDKTDAGRGIWTLPRLKRAPALHGQSRVKRPLVQGARFVSQRYAANSLSVVRWPDGRRLHTVAVGQNVIPPARAVRQRTLRFVASAPGTTRVARLDRSRQGGASPSPAGRMAVSITPPLTPRADRSPGPSARRQRQPGHRPQRPASTSKGHGCHPSSQSTLDAIGRQARQKRAVSQP